jgi:disulfide bond formation protein DsbB
MLKVRHAGAQNPTIADGLTAGERILTIFTILFGGVIIPGTIYYYGWKRRFPRKARSVLWTEGILLVLFFVGLFGGVYAYRQYVLVPQAQAQAQIIMAQIEQQQEQVQQSQQQKVSTAPPASKSGDAQNNNASAIAPIPSVEPTTGYKNPSLRVLSPLSNTMIPMNTPYTLRWDAEGMSPSTYVYLVFIPANNQTSYGIPKKILANTDSLVWNFSSTACYSNPCQNLPAGQYTLLIQAFSATDNEVTEASSGSFTLVSK